MRHAYVLAALLACQSRPTADTRVRLPAVEPPAGPSAGTADVAGYAGIRSPTALAARIATLAPGAPSIDVADKLAGALHLPRDAAKELDLGAPAWLVNPRKEGRLALVKLRDEARFTAAISRALRADGTVDGLARYLGSDGAPIYLAVVGRHAVVVDTPETWHAVGRYALETLLERQPTDDLEVHIHPDATQGSGSLERAVDELVAQALESVGSTELSNAAKQQARALAPVLEKLRPWMAAFAGARELEVRASLTDAGLAVDLSLTPGDTGGSRDLVSGTRNGPLLGAERLPPRAWLTGGAHGHPSIPSAWPAIVLDAAAGLVEPSSAPDFRKRLGEIAARAGWTGDYTLVARSDPDGTRFAAALLLGAGDAIDAERALAAAIDPVAEGRAVTAAGTAHRFELPGPPSSPKLRRIVATAAVGGIVIVAFGEGADRLLAELIAGRPPQGPSSERAQPTTQEHDGVATLSPVGLARTFVSALPLEQRVPLRGVMTVRDDANITVSWGVDPARARWKLEARLPIQTIFSVMRPFTNLARRPPGAGAGPLGL